MTYPVVSTSTVIIYLHSIQQMQTELHIKRSFKLETKIIYKRNGIGGN